MFVAKNNMKVLMITGDKNMLTPGTDAYARAELQRSQVEELKIVYWGRDSRPRIKAEEYDVVTVQDPFWRGVIALRAARRAQAKLNVQVHTDLSAQGVFRRMLARFVLRRAHSVRVVSEKLKNYLETLNLKQVNVLPIYTDVSRYVGLKHESNQRFKKVILWLGRFEPEKDPMLALSILNNVRKEGIDAGLIMLGSGSLEGALRAQAKSLDQYVEFPGWKDPTNYYAIADVVISTSMHESYGASIIEALAAKVPVVALDVGVAKEAGAVVVSRDSMASSVVKVLKEGLRGELKLNLLNKEEWAKKWLKTL